MIFNIKYILQWLDYAFSFDKKEIVPKIIKQYPLAIIFEDALYCVLNPQDCQGSPSVILDWSATRKRA